jgi:hypothetical protein
MKKLITNYTFNPAAKTIAFNDYSSIDLERILLITNVTRNVILYNFADPNKGGSISGNVLTLACDTAGMDSNDKLQIFYDDLNPATEDGNLNDSLQLLKMLIQSPLGRLAIDNYNRLRVIVDSVPTTPVSQSGTWNLGNFPIDQRWEMIQRANIEYNECQRSKFTFV